MIDKNRFEKYVRFEVARYNSQNVDKDQIEQDLRLYDHYRDNEELYQAPFHFGAGFDPKMVLYKGETLDAGTPLEQEQRRARIKNAEAAYQHLCIYEHLLLSKFGETGEIPELRQGTWNSFKVKVQRSLDNLPQEGSKLAVATYLGLIAATAVGVLMAAGGFVLMATGVGFGPGVAVSLVGAGLAAGSIACMYSFYKYREDHCL